MDTRSNREAGFFGHPKVEIMCFPIETANPLTSEAKKRRSKNTHASYGQSRNHIIGDGVK